MLGVACTLLSDSAAADRAPSLVDPPARACLVAIGAGQPDVPIREESSHQRGALPKEALHGQQGHCCAWLLQAVQGVLLSCLPDQNLVCAALQVEGQ